ncbi:MAG: GGDEF domain-containing protein [Gammaproteobacteria bacterium]|nr:GGDEF domain-containing protein [Gammaproteobacteria bacterium]
MDILIVTFLSLIAITIGLVAHRVRQHFRERLKQLEREIGTERNLHRRAKEALQKAKMELEHKVLERTASLELSYFQLNEAQQDLKAHNEHLDRLAHLDALTGIANRRYFDHVLDTEVRRARREHTELSLLVCDIDHFKMLNDHDGHPYGDYVLKKIADALNRQFSRAGDLVARIGGEEFAVILPGVARADAETWAEQLRNNIWKQAIDHNASPLGDRVSISIGGASVAAGQQVTAKALLTASDQAMYRAKNAGRNRVVFANADTFGRIEPVKNTANAIQAVN